jgi:hypothetical protein
MLLPLVKQRTRTPVRELACRFQRNQIICANEVFPESVSADPLADLEIWDEWRQNIRRFPFPGLFSPLGITSQASKTTSPTSVGVLGEIMTGLFSQAYISPWVIVRPIRRWPDFIFLCSDQSYAFVESKAFTGNPDDSQDALSRLPKSTLQECLDHAVKQLNADPFVTVWYCFTEICRIDPMELRVTFLDLKTSPERRVLRAGERILPEAVVYGLAERAASSGAAKVYQSERSLSEPHYRGKHMKSRLQQQVTDTAVNEVPQVLEGAVPKSLYEIASREVREKARELANMASPKISNPGKRMTAAKERAVEGELGELRSFGGDCLYLVDLTEQQRRSLERDWHPDWAQAVLSWKLRNRTEFWRCSSAAVGLGPSGITGRLD